MPSPRPKASREEAVYLELIRTAGLLSGHTAQFLKQQDLSATQYNVLRILRGAGEDLPCGEIADRMITRDPDITRLLDRLEQRGLIERVRPASDRRVVHARISALGLDLLARLDRPVRDLHRRLLGHLGAARLRTLGGLLEACRTRLESQENSLQRISS